MASPYHQATGPRCLNVWVQAERAQANGRHASEPDRQRTMALGPKATIPFMVRALGLVSGTRACCTR